MRLHRFEYSCYARFVQAALDLAGERYEVVNVPFGNREELATLTGGYIQVPVLEVDGAAITESRRIAEWIVARHPALVPEPMVWAYVDWAQNVLEDVAFRVATPGLAHRFASAWERALFVFGKERKFGAGCVDAWRRDADALFARVADLLAPTIATLGERAFLFGAEPTLADCALYGQLVMMEFGAPDRVATLAPALHRWKRRFEQRLGGSPYGRPAREHRTIAAIAERFAKTAAPRTGKLELVVVRTAMHVRDAPARATLAPGRGVVGDRWVARADGTADEVSIMDVRVAGAIADRDDWTLFGDNLFVDLGLGEGELAPGDRLAIGDVVLEATGYPHLGCRKFMHRFGTDALRWVNAKPDRAERRRGTYARVVTGGEIRPGDAVRVIRQ